MAEVLIDRFTPLDQLPQFLTVPEFAALFDLKSSHVYQLLADGSIPSTPFGRLRRIARATVITYAEGGMR